MEAHKCRTLNNPSPLTPRCSWQIVVFFVCFWFSCVIEWCIAPESFLPGAAQMGSKISASSPKSFAKGSSSSVPSLETMPNTWAQRESSVSRLCKICQRAGRLKCDMLKHSRFLGVIGEVLKNKAPNWSECGDNPFVEETAFLEDIVTVVHPCDCTSHQNLLQRYQFRLRIHGTLRASSLASRLLQALGKEEWRFYP